MAKKKKSIVTTATDKAKGALTTVGSTVSKNPTTALNIGIGIASVIAIYFLYDTIKDISGGFTGDKDSGGGNVGQGNPSQTPNGATITNSQAQTSAAILLSAMDGFGGVGSSDFARIKQVLRGKNAKDFALISKAFGTPKRSPLTGEESFWLLGEQLNLSQWFSKELDNGQLMELKAMLPGVL